MEPWIPHPPTRSPSRKEQVPVDHAGPSDHGGTTDKTPLAAGGLSTPKTDTTPVAVPVRQMELFAEAPIFVEPGRIEPSNSPPPPQPQPQQRTAGPAPDQEPRGKSSRGRRKLLSESATDIKLDIAGSPQSDDLDKPLRNGNVRRSTQTASWMIVMVVFNLIIIGALGYWIYILVLGELNVRLSEAFIPSRLPQSPATGSGEPAQDKIQDLDQKWTREISHFQSQMDATGKHLDEIQRQLKELTARAATQLAPKSPETTGGKVAATTPPTGNGNLAQLQALVTEQKTLLEGLEKRLLASEALVKQDSTKLKDLIVAATAAAQSAPPAATSPPASIPGGVPIADDPAGSALRPSESELLLLKERNRLTNYADEAIATASRVPLDRLWESLSDPRLANLSFAAQAEILRVRQFYMSGSRLTKYEIPVAEVFPETPNLRDVQLSDDQVLQLLQDDKQPWQTRMKAAWILGHRKSAKVCQGLLKAVKQDHNLDVVKEATFSFQQITGYTGGLFEPALMETWWKEYTHPSPVIVQKAVIPPATDSAGQEPSAPDAKAGDAKDAEAAPPSPPETKETKPKDPPGDKP